MIVWNLLKDSSVLCLVDENVINDGCFGCFLCRLCLGAWTDHGERTGGFYACNRYETAKQEGVVSWNALSATINLTKISACIPADMCRKVFSLCWAYVKSIMKFWKTWIKMFKQNLVIWWLWNLVHHEGLCLLFNKFFWQFSVQYSVQYDEAERRREMAKNSLERYTHYYERWATNESVSTGIWL